MIEEYLQPTNGQKSFYKKAKVVTDDFGNKTLYSYDSRIIVTMKGEHYPVFDQYDSYQLLTHTTLKHIKSYCGWNKKEIMKKVCEQLCPEDIKVGMFLAIPFYKSIQKVKSIENDIVEFENDDIKFNRKYFNHPIYEYKDETL